MTWQLNLTAPKSKKKRVELFIRSFFFAAPGVPCWREVVKNENQPGNPKIIVIAGAMF
jgi:hypothetical protein